MKENSRLDKYKDTIFNRIPQKGTDSTINEFYETGYLASCGHCYDVQSFVQQNPNSQDVIKGAAH